MVLFLQIDDRFEFDVLCPCEHPFQGFLVVTVIGEPEGCLVVELAEEFYEEVLEGFVAFEFWDVKDVDFGLSGDLDSLCDLLVLSAHPSR